MESEGEYPCSYPKDGSGGGGGQLGTPVASVCVFQPHPLAMPSGRHYPGVSRPTVGNCTSMAFTSPEGSSSGVDSSSSSYSASS